MCTSVVVFGALALIVVILLIYGHLRGGYYGYCIMIVAAIFGVVGNCVALFNAFPRTEIRQICWKQDNVISAIDDNGESKKYQLDKIKHTDAEYDNGDNIVIISDALGTVFYIAPAGIVSLNE